MRIWFPQVNAKADRSGWNIEVFKKVFGLCGHESRCWMLVPWFISRKEPLWGLTKFVIWKQKHRQGAVSPEIPPAYDKQPFFKHLFTTMCLLWILFIKPLSLKQFISTPLTNALRCALNILWALWRNYVPSFWIPLIHYGLMSEYVTQSYNTNLVNALKSYRWGKKIYFHPSKYKKTQLELK